MERIILLRYEELLLKSRNLLEFNFDKEKLKIVVKELEENLGPYLKIDKRVDFLIKLIYLKYVLKIYPLETKSTIVLYEIAMNKIIIKKEIDNAIKTNGIIPISGDKTFKLLFRNEILDIIPIEMYMYQQFNCHNEKIQFVYMIDIECDNFNLLINIGNFIVSLSFKINDDLYLESLKSSQSQSFFDALKNFWTSIQFNRYEYNSVGFENISRENILDMCVKEFL